MSKDKQLYFLNTLASAATAVCLLNCGAPQTSLSEQSPARESTETIDAICDLTLEVPDGVRVFARRNDYENPPGTNPCQYDVSIHVDSSVCDAFGAPDSHTFQSEECPYVVFIENSHPGLQLERTEDSDSCGLRVVVEDSYCERDF
ncbi:hypothetical protein HQ545_02100 [Candidatus Woesearchaeota archaeon]|nr:hypothetical protein [Candidatus Woesearchaeota archaeon]